MNTASLDFDAYIEDTARARHRLQLIVDGMRCVSCAFTIEAALNAEHGVEARINVTDKRLDLTWEGARARGNRLVERVLALGFTVLPFSSHNVDVRADTETRGLLRAMAVAGFGSANIMLLSFALWFAPEGTMGPATRDLFHWLMALVALPCVIYAGQPFFRTALTAVRHGRSNMDIPISLAIILSTGVSLFQTAHHRMHAYFDSAVMLLFLLLIGRWLDRRARGRARGAAHDLLLLLNGTAEVLDDSGRRTLPIEQIRAGDLLLVSAGMRIGADGLIEKGVSDLDTGIITGESLPRRVEIGDKVNAGMLNLSGPLHVRATRGGDNSLISDIVQLMQQAEQRQSAYVRLADRLAGYYTPIVHVLAALTFFGWWQLAHAPWDQALIAATTVLIITCPCALGLAVPAVQVVASSALFRRGILLKSADALERLADVDTIFFDKTGTLTEGQPRWLIDTKIDSEILAQAASLAAHSRHLLAQALANHQHALPVATVVSEVPGCGMEAVVNGKRWRLGRRSWCGDAVADEGRASLELWFQIDDQPPTRFAFVDPIRADAAATIAALKQQRYRLIMLSGDRHITAQTIGTEVGINDVQAELTPSGKLQIVEEARQQGAYTLMVGDGLNDAPALTAANVSISPATGLDITQNAADLVFQGSKLGAIFTALKAAVRARTLVRQNLGFSLVYNLAALPLAIAGQVTPLLAAAAMSSSSLIVILNALRAGYVDQSQ